MAVTWVKIDDRFAGNPKVTELSDAAFRLYVTALCWCSQHETDGFVTKKKARMLGRPNRVQELVVAKLWHETDGGYEVNDYLVYNPSRVELEQRREATRQRVTKHRCNGVTNATVTAAVTALPSRPVPIPDQIQIRTPVAPLVGGTPPSSAKPRKKSRTPAPEALAPTDTELKLAREFGVNLATEIPRMLDFHRAKGTLMSDWLAGLRTWIRNAPEFKRQQNGGGSRFTRGQPEIPERPLDDDDRERNRRLLAWGKKLVQP